MRIGLVMIAIFVVLGAIGPWLAPYDPTAIDLAHRFEPASAAHWLGTDAKGLDTLSLLLWGARSALEISVSVVAITSAIGVALGTIAGWFGGWIDEVIMRVVDVLQAFPGILLNIAIVATVKAPGLPMVIAALCINGWVDYARVARGQVLALREREYVQAAVAMGAGNRRVMFKHLVPNLMGPILVQLTLSFGGVIAVEAALSFLGLGTHTDYAWGAMLDHARTYMLRPGYAPYMLVPGLAIAWVVVGANLLGDGLRDRLDPRRGRH